MQVEYEPSSQFWYSLLATVLHKFGVEELIIHLEDIERVGGKTVVVTDGETPRTYKIILEK